MRVMRGTRPLLATLLLFAGLVSPPAWANHRTDLTSAFDDGDPYDFNVMVGYTRTLKRGAIKRELAGTGFESGTAIGKELRFSQVRHVLAVRAEAAIWRDLQLHFELPIVLLDSRELSLAENGGDSCIDSTLPSDKQKQENFCVTKNNSTLVRDNFLPDSKVLPDGLGAMIGSSDGPRGGFLLPDRKGLDQIYLGLTWAPINQVRDNTKPTWTIGAEARIAVGDAMEYNPWVRDEKTNTFSYDANRAKKNTDVGQGLHQFHFFMTLSKRFKYVDPFMSIFYLLPLAAKDSLYERTTFSGSGQERHLPQQRGGIDFGLEIIPWEVPDKDMKVSIDLDGRIEGVFEGRGYSEMWEVFANNPQLNGPCRRTVITNAEKDIGYRRWQNGEYCEDSATNNNAYIPYLGLSSIENHAVFKASLAVNAQLSKWFWARIGAALGHEQQHFITFGDAGKDKNKSGDIERFYPTASEASGINAGTLPADAGAYDEINPMYRPYIDTVGRRFRVEETTVFDFFVALQGMF